ncbi:ABC transporter permease subunit [Aerococcus urinaeequi]|uniref:ABC transporter permease subunit n=1 Tax=Aerococcus urinaeequi TaxID=51665 RepID=A0AAE9XSA4_9LACT|nr:ABC transporter permease subunit [Aerococcus urinaeequi]WCG38643.1 ABC transporter permease subunit [Aerococcus urinaeequi]
MKPWKIYQTVVIPQAVVNAVPGTLNVLISLVKGSSIVSTLGVTEVFTSAKLIASSSMLYFETYVVVGFIYWMIISWLQGKLERKIAVPYKRS